MLSCIAYIAIGSNLENPSTQVENAVKAIAKLEHTRLMKVSRWFQSEALGPSNQADYLNGMVEVKTTLAPEDLLEKLFEVENSHGRIRKVRWGARTLDLDLIAYDTVVIAGERLTLPHPRAAERNFVIYPLHELAPELLLKDKSVSDIYRTSSCHGLIQLQRSSDYRSRSNS